jgi:hypothetical protein
MCRPLVQGLSLGPQAMHGDPAEHLLFLLTVLLYSHAEGVLPLWFGLDTHIAGFRSEGPRMDEGGLVGRTHSVCSGQSATICWMGIEGKLRSRGVTGRVVVDALLDL